MTVNTIMEKPVHRMTTKSSGSFIWRTIFGVREPVDTTSGSCCQHTFVELTVLLLVFLLPEMLAMSEEKRLIKDLLKNYEEVGLVGRPVYNMSQMIKVSYGIALIQILDLEEKNQVLTTNIWCRYAWTDILLRWKPEEYGDIDHVRVPVNKIWRPDIVLYNYADTRLKEHRDAMAVVSSTGDVLWIPAAIFRSTCSIDILYFPFDTQECNLKFGSWTYDGFKLDLDFYNGIEEIDVTDYVESNEWKLLKHPAKKNVKFYPCCKEPFPDLTFTIRVKRIAIFYSFILIVPCVLLSFLTLVSFWLPPESPAKVLLGMNLFVAFFLLLRILADSTPPASSRIPLIGAFFCLNMIIITLSSFLSATVINLYMRTDKQNKVPAWLKKVTVDILARMLFMEQTRPVQKPKRQRDHVTHHMTHVITGSSSGGGRKLCKEKRTIKSPILPYNKWEPPPPPQPPPRPPRQPISPSTTPRHQNHVTENHAQTVTDATTATTHRQLQQEPLRQRQQQQQLLPGSERAVIEAEVREIKRMLKSFMTKVQQRDARDRVAQEWRLVALTLDRLFFFVYLATILIALVAIFPWSEAFSSSELLR